MKLFGLLFWFCILLIFYVYAGYPLIVALLARLRRKVEKYGDITPKVSILIAAYNEQDVIAAKLENTLALDYPAECRQIVVAVDGSDDRTAEIVQSFDDRGVELSYGTAQLVLLDAFRARLQPRPDLESRGSLQPLADCGRLEKMQNRTDRDRQRAAGDSSGFA